MRKGDKLICKETVNNIFGMPLFEKGKEYEVLYIDNETLKIMVTLNHNLYGNEYNNFPIDYINKNFSYVER